MEKIKYVSFERNTRTNAILESDRLFPTNDLSWIRNQLDVSDFLIIFDSISSFVLRYGVVPTIRFLHELVMKGNRVFSIIHRDCHDLKEYEKIIHDCDAMILINRLVDKYIVKIQSRKKKSKLVLTELMYRFDRGEMIPIKTKESNSTNLGVEIDSSIPFKLGLSEKELNDRSKVSLPYVKTNAEVDQVQEVYMEDPDDDLDL